MIFLSSPLFSLIFVLVGFVPQRVATLWFYERNRMTASIILYYAFYAPESVVLILQKEYGHAVGFG